MVGVTWNLSTGEVVAGKSQIPEATLGNVVRPCVKK